MATMRVTIRQPRALLLAALVVACASRPRVPPFERMPTPLPPGSPRQLRPVAKHAGTIFAFQHTTNTDEAPPEIQRMRAEMRELFGIDVAANDVARLGVDPKRPIVVSWGIVDPDQLFGVITAKTSPTRDTPFVIRAQIAVPVVDLALTADALAKVTLGPTCARRPGDPERWAAAIAHLPDAADRLAAERSGVTYFCRGDSNASVLWFDEATRELIWVGAAGWGPLLAHAAASVEIDGGLAGRLQRDGFFTARAGVYTTPADEARLYTGTGLIKIEAAIRGIDAPMRDRIWRQGLWEVTATSRLIDGAPQLFEDVRIADRAASWTLTDTGKTFFASLGLGRTTDAEQVKNAIVSKVKPKGLFADREKLLQTVHEAGSGAFLLIHHFLWPHALAFAASIPETAPSIAADWTGAGGTVEIDAQAGFVRASGDSWK